MGTLTEPPKGKFIVFEGLDGSGITEQVELFKEWLRNTGYDLSRVEFTHEPSDGPVGLVLEMALQERLMGVDENTMAFLFAADRSDHLSRFIIPRLDDGRHVISERYALSFYAYQASQKLSFEWLRSVGRVWLRPDLTIFLNTPPEQCLENLKRRFARQRYEKEDMQQRAWDEFQRIVVILRHEGERIEVIDGSGDALQVHQRILPIVVPFFLEKINGG